MFFDRYLPAVAGHTLPDPKTDFRAAEKLGPCRISQTAVYLPDRRYILRADITHARADQGCAHVTGCCAGGVPVPRVVITAGGLKFPVLFDSEESAGRLAALLHPSDGTGTAE